MKNRRNIQTTFHYCLTFFSLLTQVLGAKENMNIEVGMILDMRSIVGKTIYSCINMAISDFYSINSAYKTRIVLRSRDSKGDPLLALSAANDLVEKNKVEAIIGPQTYLEEKFLAVFSNKYKVPIFSFTSSPPSSFTQYPYFSQIGQDESTQFKAIASLVESFKWRYVIFIYEDTDYGREILPYMVESFLEKDIKIAYTSAISPLLDQVLEELHKLMKMQTTIFIVHTSPLLASNFFLQARRLGMVGEEYVWILTDKTMDVLHTTDPELVESLQGVIGLRSYIPPSNELQNFTLRWGKEQSIKRDLNVEGKEISVFGILAYDAIWSLAKAIERIGLANIGVISKSGKTLVSEVSKIRFEGISGKYEFVNGKLIARPFQVVNVIGKYERRLGFWTLKTGITKKIKIFPSSSISTGLEAIIWPGGSTTTPTGWLMRRSGKKLRIGYINVTGFKELLHMELNNQTNKIIGTGFCIDVFRAAVEALTYKIDYELIPILDASETYNDLVYDQLYLQKYDAVVGDITITANRSQYVDFTLPYTDVGVGIIAKIVNQKDMWIFLRPLDKDLWLTSLAFFILTGFIVWVIEHPSNSEFQGSLSQQIGTVFSFTFSTLVFAHREKITNNLSKFVVVVWLFVVLILSSSYTATLTSFLTVQQIQLTTKRDFIGFPSWSFLQGIVLNNSNFEDNKLRIYNSPEEYVDALFRGSKNGGVSAIIDEIPYLKIVLGKYPDDYAMVTSQPITNGFAFAFQKGSPLVSDISREIVKLREEGELMKMEDKWFMTQSSSVNQNSAVTKPKTLNSYNFRGLFLITGLSSTLALLIFLIYLLHQYLKQLLNNFIFKLLGDGSLALMV